MLTIVNCPHTEPKCETEAKCADRERFRQNCESIRFGGYTQQTQDWRQRDRDFAKDNEAYKRLRKQGLQPRGVDKSSLLESHADHAVEVAVGRPASTTEKKAWNRHGGSLGAL